MGWVLVLVMVGSPVATMILLRISLPSIHHTLHTMLTYIHHTLHTMLTYIHPTPHIIPTIYPHTPYTLPTLLLLLPRQTLYPHSPPTSPPASRACHRAISSPCRAISRSISPPSPAHILYPSSPRETPTSNTPLTTPPRSHSPRGDTANNTATISTFPPTPISPAVSATHSATPLSPPRETPTNIATYASRGTLGSPRSLPANFPATPAGVASPDATNSTR